MHSVSSESVCFIM